MGVHEDGARGQSDWTDQDLLTRAEAAERLATERALVEERLAGELDPSDRAACESRLAALAAVLDRMTPPGSRVMPIGDNESKETTVF